MREKKTIVFSYRVRGDFSPEGLQKIFFSFHPSDTAQMNRIAEDFLSIANCAIYFHSDSFVEDEVDLDDYAFRLREMKLFVVIVTTNYLCSSSLARNWEYGFAARHNIPIIPIAVEEGLEDFFTVEMNRIGAGFGDIQLLKSQVSDKTAIAYRQKLQKDLSAILVNDPEIEQIRKAFSGRIFLSYRKKDRRYANELMKTIHNIPSLEKVAIWYDEFITTGENWSERIGDAIKNSDVFLLMITPSITEPDNYVIREEYPAARKLGKKIVSAKKSVSSGYAGRQDHSVDQKCAGESDRSTGQGNSVQCGHNIDYEALRVLFPDLKTYVDGDNTTELEEALSDLSDSSDSTAERDYLVGLAFFNGIEVEKDDEKAVSLIIAAAKRDLPAAIRKLADMYWIGDGLAVNYENSILWRKKLVALYPRHFDGFDKNTDRRAMSDYIQALEDLTSCLYELSAFRDSLKYGKRLASFLEKITASAGLSEFAAYMERAYDLCGKNCRRLGLFDEAIAYAEKGCAVSRNRYEEAPGNVNLHNLSVAYERLGDAFYSIGDFQQTEKWYQKAIKIDQQIDKETKTPASAYALSCSMLVLGDLHMRNGAYEAADVLYAQAAALRKRILDAENTSAHRKEYGETITSRGTSLMLKGSLSEAEKLFTEARDIYRGLAERSGTIESQHAYSVVLNRCGKLREMNGDLEQALAYYSDSLNRRKKILSHIRTSESIYEYALALFFKAEAERQLSHDPDAKNGHEEVVNLLLPLLPEDRKGDWHKVLSKAAFQRFLLDTFSGEPWLRHAIDAQKWLVLRNPENKQYQKQYELFRKMYRRCYPEQTNTIRFKKLY